MYARSDHDLRIRVYPKRITDAFDGDQGALEEDHRCFGGGSVCIRVRAWSWYAVEVELSWYVHVR